MGAGLHWPSHVHISENTGCCKGRGKASLEGPRWEVPEAVFPAKSTSGPSHPVVWAQTALPHNTLPDTPISLLSFTPPFLVLQPFSSVYLCDFGCVLYLFGVCFSHWAAMFALLMILFPTSGAVSCTQQMLRMFLWIMNEFSNHISPWNSHNSSVCMFLLPGSHLLIPQNPLTPVCSYSSSNKPAVFCNSISRDQVSSFLGCQAVFCQRDRQGAGDKSHRAAHWSGHPEPECHMQS